MVLAAGTRSARSRASRPPRRWRSPRPRRGSADPAAGPRGARETRARQRRRTIRLAEEPGHVDQQVLVEAARFVGVALEQLDVVADVGEPVQRHPPEQPPLDRRQLVVPEVDAADRPAAASKIRCRLLGAPRRARRRTSSPARGRAAPSSASLAPIAAGGSTRSTMPVAIAARGMPSYFADSGDLREGDAAGALDLAQPDRAVGGGAREDRRRRSRSCSDSASDTRKASIGVCCERSSGRGERCSSAPRISICTFGGIT